MQGNIESADSSSLEAGEKARITRDTRSSTRFCQSRHFPIQNRSRMKSLKFGDVEIIVLSWNDLLDLLT